MSKQLVDLALRDYRFAQTPHGETFAVPKHGPQVARSLRYGHPSFRAELSHRMHQETGKVANQQALADAITNLEGHAQKNREALHLRVARDDEDAWLLDLGDHTGHAVRTTPDGWSTVDSSPRLFRRTALTATLPEPQTGGALGELWAHVNVAVEDQPLVLAWLIHALDPLGAHTILAIDGEQGTGKSTATRRLASLIDPSTAATRKPPRNDESWQSSASGSWVVPLDNLSTIADWFSDLLCRAVTGEGHAQRKLYTDGDLFVTEIRRAILINGIDLGAVRPDLAERLLCVQLHEIAPQNRKPDADLDREWAEAQPRILGALLDLAVKVRAALSSSQPSTLPRMADFARIQLAVDTVLGTTGMDRYTSQAGNLAADAIADDPVLAAIAEQFTESFEGSSADLLDRIAPPADDRRPRGWPDSPTALTRHLKRQAPALRKSGWTVDDLGRGGHAKALRWRIEPPQSTGNGGGSAGTAAQSQASLPAPERGSNPRPDPE